MKVAKQPVTTIHAEKKKKSPISWCRAWSGHLSDDKITEHVHANGEEETDISRLQRVYLTGDEPT